MVSEPISIRFVSRNQHKLDEASAIFAPVNIAIVPLKTTIEELQTSDTDRLVRDKALKAFEQVGRPLFVEHTGLYLKYLNGLPGGLTQLFWDSLEADRFATLFGGNTEPQVTAKTVVGYTDAKKFYIFRGEISGRISPVPRGSRSFQWDCVFVPDGYDQTFAEMGEEKNRISMRRRALDELARFLKAEASK